jgi:multiple sugar transport system permease protein
MMKYKKLLNWLDGNIKIVFIAPSVVFVIVMIIFPLVYNLGVSFTEWSLSNLRPPRFIGINNYVNLMKDSRFLFSAGRTLVFSLGSLAMEVVIGVAIAVYINRSFHGKDLVKTALLLPMVMTPVAVGMIWMLIFEPTIGLANYVLRTAGIKPLVWLGDKTTALISLMIVDIWEWTPMISLVTLSGLSAIPEEPYESAKVDGATSWQILWRITIPMISSTVLIASMLRLIDVLKTFDIIYSTTQGGPGFATETINIFGYLQAFQYFQFGSASAVLVIFFIFILVCILFFLKLKDRLVVER